MSNKYNIPSFPSSLGNSSSSAPERTVSCNTHPSSPAVDKCKKCGKPVCQSCAETFRVDSGDYEGKALCCNCCCDLVELNVRALKKERRKIEFHFAFSIIGMLAGFIYGFVIPYLQWIHAGSIDNEELGFLLLIGFVYACVGGCFFAFIRFFLVMLWECIKIGFRQGLKDGLPGVIGVVIGFFINMVIGIFKCVIETFKNTFYYIKRLRECDKYLAIDEKALKHLKKYRKRFQH